MDKHDLIQGVEAIESELKRDYLFLMDLKVDFGFPMLKMHGRPCVSRAALQKWISDVAGGIPIESVTIPIIRQIHYRRDLEAMQSFQINGLDAICLFVRQPADVLINWLREDGCPIRKKDKEYSSCEVNARELLLWMLERGFKKGNYSQKAMIRIAPHGDGDAPKYI